MSTDSGESYVSGESSASAGGMEGQYEGLISDVVRIKQSLRVALTQAQKWLSDTGHVGNIRCYQWQCRPRGQCDCYDMRYQHVAKLKDDLVALVEAMEWGTDVMDMWVGRMTHEMEAADVSRTLSVDSCSSDCASCLSTLPDLEQPVALTTGLRKMPTELIVAILELATERDRTIPLVLSHSNSFFRQLVIAAPSLWKHIDIMDGRSMTEAYLARSGTTPLHVRITLFPTIDIDAGCQRIDEFSQILAPHVSRVLALDIGSVHPQWVAAVIPLIESGSWGELYFLGVKIVNNVPELYDDAPDCDVSGTVCKARRLHLQGITGRFSSSVIFSNVVQELHLTEVSDHLVLDALANMLSLERLVLSHLRPELSDGQLGSLPTVHIAALRYAELVSKPAGCLADFIIAPNLETLILANNALDGSTPLQFLERTEQLQDLDISGCSESALDNWEDFLWAVLFLTRLRLCGTMACTHHLCALIAEPGDEDDVSCPNLEELVLENEEVGSDIIRRIVSSRLAPDGTHSTIRSVVMRGCDEDCLCEDGIEEIQRCVAEFVLETWGTRHIVRGEDDDGFLSSSSSVDTESEDEQLASGDEAIIQGLVHAFPA
ncbi:hypothetical protein FRB99_000155 [Tulasnella sp. 403]|nr:hypothetical protein FRB99_000155 [Tulasnella sp. 403]